LPIDSDEHRCFGRDKDGTKVAETKCQHTHEFVIPLPDAVAGRPDIPFKWVLLNWNPAGHIPPGVYNFPHFDVHFEMGPIADVFAIEPDRVVRKWCAAINSRRREKPIPANYMAPDYVDVEAVVPAMGNHLIDTTGTRIREGAVHPQLDLRGVRRQGDLL
jgi:hypothetical protein